MNVFDLFAKITLDQSEYDEGLKDSEKKANSFSDKLKKGLSVAGKVGGAAVAGASAALTAASGAAVAMMKKSVDNYAEYEQLVGGAQLMFGDAYDFVAEKAENAYKTVQMSQNDYLQQVNGFATGLKTALGGNEQAAAELADRILTAEADVVAATGNSQEAVQNAFNGIMKSNYTMLDNLQLGINPTKEGMQEVIDKVNDWNKANGKASDYVIDNLADVQSALVDYIEMQGLAGYAANEASQTISGSLSSLKSAWSNLLTGLASGDDIGDLVDNLVESAETVLDNILPIGEKALEGIGKLVENIAPVVADRLPGLVETMLPPILSAATSLVIGLVNALPTIIQVLINQAPVIISSLVQALIATVPAIIDAGRQLVTSLTGGMDPGQLAQKGLELLTKLLATIASKLPEMLQKGIELVGQLAAGLIRAIPKAVAAIPQIISRIRSSFGQFDWASIGLNIITGIARGIAHAAGHIGEALMGAVKGAWNKVTGWLGINSPSKLAEQVIGKNWVLGIGEGFEKYMPIDEMVGSVENAFKDIASLDAPTIYANGSGSDNGTQAGSMGSGRIVIEVPLVVDGREIAKVIAPYTQGELSRLERNQSRKVGVVL